MYKQIKLSMSVVMVVCSIVAASTYTQDRIHAIRSQTNATLAKQPVQNQLPQYSPLLSDNSLFDDTSQNSRTDADKESVDYREKKAKLVRSYQLEDPRAKPAMP